MSDLLPRLRLGFVVVLTALAVVLSPVRLAVRAETQAMKPIQEPITGKEELGDLSQPQQALAQFYRAFNTRDLAMIDDNLAPSDEVAISTTRLADR